MDPSDENTASLANMASLTIAANLRSAPAFKKDLQEEAFEESVEHEDEEDSADAPSLRRVLAKVIRLEHVSKHPSAEHLNVAQIGGWKVVVAPEEVAGTLGVFFEIDSVLPADEEWVKAIRMPSKSMFQVRSVKIRGCLSQGLFVGMHKLPLLCSGPVDEEKWLQQEDVTAILGIMKRPEHVVRLNFKSYKHAQNVVRIPFSQVFPDGPCKTEEFRVQSFMHLLDAMMGKPYYITVKVDGMSATYGYDEGRGGLVACSRNYMVELEETLIGELCKTYGLAEKLKEHPNLVIQGEAYGPPVNKNLLQAREVKLAVFNVYDKVRRRRLPYVEMVATCEMLKLPMVPLEEVGDNFQYTFDELLQKAKGFYRGTKNHREGLVARCQEQYDGKGYLSFKVINNDYLLKHGH
ncbi:hypothetical protein GOP47_0006648 [Adiantum capillus-veneris]|uniref:RNA ligase domain-containing protein n=1 Tax=Adiantum capillus-veneris TaxID=13818 RepID=A0A9D4V423_ADICA|nr:hypothetical protein GOP47_0006648 [Adiantum capillus-veneris]